MQREKQDWHAKNDEQRGKKGEHGNKAQMKTGSRENSDSD
jgi:hypothetical protein